MSKIKKNSIKRLRSISKEDMILEKIMQFSGWIFLLVLGIFLGIWGFLDLIDISEIKLEAVTFTFIIFTGTSSALSFGLATRIKNNRDKKKEIIIDWMLGEFLFSMFAIFAIAAYQW